MSSELSAGTTPGAGANNSGFPSATTPTSGNGQQDGSARVPHIRIVPHIVDVRHCLYFEVMDRDVPENTILKVGRFTEKVSQQMSRIAFKSKVVSRSHAEIWTENGQFYIKDTKSSSGTFLNHMRLSPPGVESRPHPLHDGDILQLGVDYQGGTLDIYKCVKIRLEINRNWQRSKENPFRRQVMENIQNAYHSIGGSAVSGGGGAEGDSNNECCICLYQMVAFQALFVAPCSHCFHFKCVKPILFTSTGFSCPLCRTYADLEASVTIDENEMDVDAKPPVLPSSIQQSLPQHQQPSQQPSQQQEQQPQMQQPLQPLPPLPSTAAADAEAAVIAAEAGGLRVPGSGNAGDIASRGITSPEDSTGVSGAERDDANSTPVPNESMTVDSFGTTPVGSMPTNLAHLGALAAPAAGDADASLVGGSSNAHDHSAVDPMQVSSPSSADQSTNASAAAVSEAANASAACSRPIAAPSGSPSAAAAGATRTSGSGEA